MTHRSVPHPLAALLTAVLILGLAWALLLPPWQAPDEPAHFDYADTVAWHLRRPGDSSIAMFSEAQVLAGSLSNADQTAASLATKPEWSQQAYLRWKQSNAELKRTKQHSLGGPNPAAENPPLYYGFVAAGDRVVGGDPFNRLYFMRIMSVLLLLLTTTAGWLLAGEVFGKVPSLQLLTAAIAGLFPMATFVSASVNPDSMLFAFWGFTLWLGVRVIKRGATWGSCVSLVAVLALALLTKATAATLIPAVGFALTVALLRTVRTRQLKRILTGIVATVAIAILIGAGTIAMHSGIGPITSSANIDLPNSSRAINPREFTSYLWQFYLPALPFQQKIAALSGHRAKSVLVQGGLGSFGWLEIQYPGFIFAIMVLLASLVGVLALIYAKHHPPDITVGLFFALAAFGLLFGLHMIDYVFIRSGGAFMQGRYLFPLLPIAGIIAACAVRGLPSGWRLNSVATGLALLFVLQVFSLGLIAGRFYA